MVCQGDLLRYFLDFEAHLMALCSMETSHPNSKQAQPCLAFEPRCQAAVATCWDLLAFYHFFPRQMGSLPQTTLGCSCSSVLLPTKCTGPIGEAERILQIKMMLELWALLWRKSVSHFLNNELLFDSSRHKVGEITLVKKKCFIFTNMV